MISWLCDAHLPRALKKFLEAKGDSAVHVLDILQPNATDHAICAYADKHNLVVITKDSDFRDTHFILQTPRRLVKINLGNLSNPDLLHFFAVNWDALRKPLYKDIAYIEIDKAGITIID